MLAKQVVAHTTCEQIRSSVVLGKKPYRAWPSRQPDSSNVVNSTRFWQNRHKNNIRTALVAVGISQLSGLRDPCRVEPALSMTAASSAQDGCRGEQQPALRMPIAWEIFEIRGALRNQDFLGLAMVQPINLGSGIDPIAYLDCCGALSRLRQMVKSDHGLADGKAINRLVAVYQRRSLPRININFIFVVHLLRHFASFRVVAIR
jgi:hypothetical protein